MPKITVDGKTIDAKPGQMVLQACNEAGINLPQYCYHPGLSIVARAGDLASASRSMRSGAAIAAVYIPADFERDLKAGRRQQVIAFYNQQFLTAAAREGAPDIMDFQQLGHRTLN